MLVTLAYGEFYRKATNKYFTNTRSDLQLIARVQLKRLNKVVPVRAKEMHPDVLDTIPLSPCKKIYTSGKKKVAH